MVTRWGLSERLGPLSYGEEENEVFLGHSVTQHKNISDDTAHAIDMEIRSIIDNNYKRAETLLTENSDILHAMAQALIKYETIDAGQIDDLMARREVRPPREWSDNPPPSGSGTATGDEPEKGRKDSGGPIGDPAGQH
jgi:cell division protease FtsH